MPIYTDDRARNVNFYLDRIYQGEVEFFRSFVAEGEAILELACGAGRVMRQLALLGHEVFGIDASMPMLQEGVKNIQDFPGWARGKIHFICGDMRQFCLKRKFSLVIIPYNSFWYNLDYAEAKSCVTCMIEHILPGGSFVIDTPGIYESDTWWPFMSREFGFSMEIKEYPVWAKWFTCERVSTALVGKISS